MIEFETTLHFHKIKIGLTKHNIQFRLHSSHLHSINTQNNDNISIKRTNMN